MPDSRTVTWIRRNPWPTAVVADVLVVLVFAAIGRASHDEAAGLTGVAHTAWPFLIGTALALALSAYTRANPLGLRVAIRVWLWTVVIGMVVRSGTGAGTAPAFVIVALVFLGVCFLSWRAALRVHRLRSFLKT